MSSDILSFVGLEDASGGPPRSFSVRGAQFVPLGYDELSTLNGPATLALRFYNGEVLDTDIPGIPPGSFASGQATLQSPFASRAIGLVNGGWLPSSLASYSGALVLADRCVVSDLRGRFASGVRSPNAEPDFLDLFADSDIRLNPFLVALEGNNRRIPTQGELQQQWIEAQGQLQTALPKAQILTLNPVLLEGAMGILRSSLVDFQIEQKFLAQVAPSLVSPVAFARKHEKGDRIIEIANSLGVKRWSLALIAALSVVYAPNNANPAKRLLKVRPSYSASDAYNALADLRSLNILMHLYATHPRDPVMLCTKDKDLALFWVGLKASAFGVVGRHMHFDLAPASLFPGVEADRLQQILGFK